MTRPKQEQEGGWVVLVVPKAERERAANRVAEVTDNPESDTPEYFSIPLCHIDDPHGEITHYLASPRARKAIINELDTEATKWPECHVALVRHDDLSREWCLHVPTWLERINLQYWTPPDEETP